MYDLGNVECLSPILVIYHAFVYCPTLKLKNATIMTKFFDRLLDRFQSLFNFEPQEKARFSQSSWLDYRLPNK